MQTGKGAYTFQAQPRPVLQSSGRGKYRDPLLTEAKEDVYATCNIMFDPRVVRGPTAKPVMGSTQQLYPQPTSRELIAAQKEQKQQLVDAGKIRPVAATIQELHENIVVVKPRIEVPLHLYLEEQAEPTHNTTVETQTDEFAEPPPSPPYIPVKRGIDAAVQVDTAGVFNFSEEVEPILQVVLSKVLEQSLMEVRQEEEMKQIRRNKSELEAKAEHEFVEAQKREKLERDRLADKEKRLAEARKRALKEREFDRKVEAQAIAKTVLRGLQSSVMDELSKQGVLYDPTVKQVGAFMPWLMSEVTKQLKAAQSSQTLIDELITASLGKLKAEQKDAEDKRRRDEAEAAKQAEMKRLAEEEVAKRTRKVQLYIHTNIVEKSPVGPIHLSASSTVQEVEDKIIDWMDDNMEDPPTRDKLRFLWNNAVLDRKSVLYEVGIENLSTIQMQLIEQDKKEDEEEAEDDGDV